MFGGIGMSGYNTEFFVSDFSERTQINYKKILNSTDSNRYEITQLINSLLGLVVIPSEAYFKKAGNIGSIKMCKEEVQKIDSIVQKCIKEKRYYCDYGTLSAIQFIKHIRNSVAHGGNKGLMFYPLPEGDEKRIEYVIFYDEDTEKQKKFCAKMKIKELREFVKATAELYCKIDKKEGKDDWWDRVDSCEKLFDSNTCKYSTYEMVITHGR